MSCTVEAVRDWIDRELSPARCAHSLRVAELAAELCRRFGTSVQAGYLAGLAHDLAREMPEHRLISLSERDGRAVSEDQARYPVLLHGRAAAVILRHELAEGNPEILEAVACHVTGRPGMGLLARIVFAADFLEPGRGLLSEASRARILRMQIDGMMRRVLERIFTYLRCENKPIAAEALELYRECGRKNTFVYQVRGMR